MPASSGYCAEHPQAAPRAYFTPQYTVVNLDDLLTDAERHAKASAELDRAEAEIRELKARIAAFDASREQSDGKSG